MKEIPLTRGQWALVDDEDYEFLMQWKWFAKWDIHTKSFYAIRNDNSTKKRGAIFMHRVIMNTPKGIDCDHIDWNTLNDQKSNLRNCSRSNNIINTKLRRDNTTGYKGVVRTVHGKWCTRIVKNQKTAYQKNFDTAIDAARAYDAKVKELFGEYAFLNFPEQVNNEQTKL